MHYSLQHGIIVLGMPSALQSLHGSKYFQERPFIYQKRNMQLKKRYKTFLLPATLFPLKKTKEKKKKKRKEE